MMINKHTAGIIRSGLTNGRSHEDIANAAGVPIERIADYVEKPAAKPKGKAKVPKGKAKVPYVANPDM